MKLRNLLELKLPQNSECFLPVNDLRANWWFNQMRKVVDSVSLFDPEPFIEPEGYATPRWLRSKPRPRRTPSGQ